MTCQYVLQPDPANSLSATYIPETDDYVRCGQPVADDAPYPLCAEHLDTRRYLS